MAIKVIERNAREAQDHRYSRCLRISGFSLSEVSLDLIDIVSNATAVTLLSGQGPALQCPSRRLFRKNFTLHFQESLNEETYLILYMRFSLFSTVFLERLTRSLSVSPYG